MSREAEEFEQRQVALDKAFFAASAELQAEFLTEADYVAFRAAERREKAAAK